MDAIPPEPPSVSVRPAPTLICPTFVIDISPLSSRNVNLASAVLNIETMPV